MAVVKKNPLAISAPSKQPAPSNDPLKLDAEIDPGSMDDNINALKHYSEQQKKILKYTMMVPKEAVNFLCVSCFFILILFFFNLFISCSLSRQ